MPPCRRATWPLQPRWVWLFLSCLIAVLACDRVAPVVLWAAPPAAPDAVPSLSSRPESPLADRWSGLANAIRHLPAGTRRTLVGDSALAPGALTLPALPWMPAPAAATAGARNVTYQHERFYIHPRAPTPAAAPTT